MSIRSQRFTDTEYKSASRSYNNYNPYAIKPVPDFKTVQSLLAQERKASSNYNIAWINAEKNFQMKKKSSPQYFKATTPDECYIAVVAYTVEVPNLYQDFNKKFRQLTNDASWTAFPYKSFYYLLLLAKDGITNEPKINQTLYRGMSIHFPSDPKTGDWFYFDYVASCTSDRSTAESFAGTGGTLIELKDGASTGIGIKHYSIYPSENEVLVYPTNKFKVEKFEKQGSKHKLVLVKAGTI